MYTLLVEAHNVGRWLVLGAAAWALARAWRGRLRRAPWAPAERASGLAFTSLLNLQVLSGVALYFLSPLPGMLWADYGAMAKVSGVRFFALDHPGAMLLAAAIAQLAYSRAKRAPTDALRFRRAAVGYTAAVVLLVATIPWPFLHYGRRLWPA